MADLNIPQDLKYTDSDEWVKALDGGEALVGITDYAQDALSDLVYVEFPDVGDEFDAREEFGAVESVKASAPLKLPIGGEILEINEVLEEEPETINSDPYGAGWIVKIKVADSSELDVLLDAAAYDAHCKARE